MNLRSAGWLMLLAGMFAVSQSPGAWASPVHAPDAQTVPTRIRTTQPTQPPAPTQRPASPGPGSAPTSPSQPGSTQATVAPRPTDTLAAPTEIPRATNPPPAVATASGGTSGAQTRAPGATSVTTGTLTPGASTPTRAGSVAAPTATLALVVGATEDSTSVPLLLCGGGGLVLLGLVLLFARGRLAPA